LKNFQVVGGPNSRILGGRDMAVTAFNLPQDVPWRLLTASDDMMDLDYSTEKFPPPWRSSLAIAAYEPPDEYQPLIKCGEKIVLLKIVSTLTGYTPSGAEIEEGLAILLGRVPELTARDILGEYFGCYGALVNISVFVNTRAEGAPIPATIVDIEPKMRDLYQAATEEGELLTSSSSEVVTTKCLSGDNLIDMNRL
jgi:hypothetical protein